MHPFFAAIDRTLRRGVILAVCLSSVMHSNAGDTYKWTVQYLIDNSQVVQGQSQKVSPRRNRGLAMSPDGKYLYAGYHHGGNGEGEVRKIAIGPGDDFTKATVRVLRGPQGKSIATDDKGRVFIATEGEIMIFDADLSSMQFSLQTVVCEGMAVVREGNELALYTSDRQLGVVGRWVIEEKDNVVSNISRSKTFGENGEVVIKGAVGLRGVEVDKQGRVWVADHDGGRVYRVSKDGKNIESVEVVSPLDIGIDGDRAFVTLGRERQITVLESESLKLLGNLAVPWSELELAPAGNNRIGELSGIVTVPGKGFFVSNESGQTADHKSTYGRPDTRTDIVNGKLYRDAFDDDNDPILQALVVPDGK
ncbi:MAG: SMP-30/Gluconolactonase/LRE-like region [Verrucomicrobiota bacterium]|jgi:DNA-binding beta-propeller fold protein YncE